MPIKKDSNLVKKIVVWFLISFWIIFSIGYIGFDQWRDFQGSRIQQAYELGRNDTVRALISEVSKCEQPVPVFADDSRINVVAVECIQEELNNRPAPTPPPAPTPEPETEEATEEEEPQQN